jgi:hypothetical protein
MACCNGKCTDTNTDPNNCGGCAAAGGQACVPPPGAAAICVQGKCNFVCNEFGLTNCGNQCCCAINPGQVITKPGSNNNYLLAVSPTTQFGCNPIDNLKVSFKVTKNMVAVVTPAGGGTPTQNGGFSMQLNAYNPAGPATSWMQYVLQISGNAIEAQVQYWNIAAFNNCINNCNQNCVNQGGNVNQCQAQCPGQCVNPQTQTVNLSQHVLDLSSNTIPAGYVLEIDLNNDGVGNITGANFSVTDNNGNTKSATVPLDANHQFPIVAFQVNFVGPGNTSNSQFSSGAGTITYGTSSGQLCAEGGLPDVCSKSSGSSTPTAETSNATYSTIGWPCCASQLTQSLST